MPRAHARTPRSWFTGEKARRRDPRVYAYLAIPCPDTKEVRATAAMDTHWLVQPPTLRYKFPAIVVVPRAVFLCGCVPA
jgi:hypothetical protein